jgi:hypothetical protein
MVRKASGKVLGVVLRELGEGARLAAGDSVDDVGHQRALVLAVGRGYKGEFVGTPAGQTALGDESSRKARGSAAS